MRKATKLRAPETNTAIKTELVSIASLERPPELVCRARGVDAKVIEDYSEALAGGASFPPITIFREEDRLWVGDGHHRLGAHEKLGRTEILAEIRPGTRLDALAHAAGANSQHGLRRTNADKRRAIELVLHAYPAWADARVASTCCVSDKTVAGVRAKLGNSEVAREGSDGKVRRAPKKRKSKRVRLDHKGLLRDWKKLSGVRRQFTDLASRWREQRPDVAAAFESVVEAVNAADQVVANGASREAAPSQAPARPAARRRLVQPSADGARS